MESKEIIEAFKANPNLVAEILPAITEAEPVKTLITNKSKAMFDENIGEEIKKVHQRYDDDVFEVLGVRAGTKEGGAKQKTYELVKEKLVEFKTLNEMKDSLNKDETVKTLNETIEKLKISGGGKEVKEMFDSAKTAWEAKEAQYKEQIENAGKSNEDFKKATSIKTAFNGLKFNPDTSESIKKLVLDNVEKELIKNSKLNEEGELVFLTADGKIDIDPNTYKPKTASQVISGLEAIKDISLKTDNNKGGGASSEIVGSIKIVKVEGKDDEKQLILPEGIKSKQQFTTEADKALLASGITKRNPLWNTLKDKAYAELNIKELPMQ